MRNIILASVALIIIGVAAPKFLTSLIQSQPQAVAEKAPAQAALARTRRYAGSGEVEIRSAANGHFYLDAEIDGAGAKTLQPVEYYFKAPEDLGARVVIAVDPMLATANSAIAAVERLKERGARDVRFVCLLAAPEGVKKFRAAHPDVPVVTAAIDSHLNEKGYIVPGLGDAGDRLYGTK